MSKIKKVLFSLGAVLLIVAAFFTGHYAGAASKTPGSTGDPLITLSYLEGRLAKAGSVRCKVQLGKGQKLTGKQGTGIVVLGGSATADGAGLVDLTSGSLTESDTSLFAYHSYVITEDNTGCAALASCTVLVTGEYEVN